MAGTTEEAPDRGVEKSQVGEPISPSPASKPYSVFTARHRRILTAVLALTSLASPFTANIYMPLLPLLAVHYHSSAQAINLTLTLYVVVQAIMPAFIAPMADMYGRRPISIVTYMIYVIASIALAINDYSGNYPALLVLRALQALGVSACASITYGVIADVCIPADRGAMVGPAVSAANVGVVLGPVLGGLIGWREGSGAWVFWTLAIFGAVSLGLMMICLPETARTVVGDGSEGKRLCDKNTSWSWILLGPQWGKKRPGERSQHNGTVEKVVDKAGLPRLGAVAEDLLQPGVTKTIRHKGIPNPFAAWIVIFEKDTSLILWLASCNYATNYCLSAALPTIYKNIYGWNELAVGLAYLPGAVTIITAGMLNGRWAKYRFQMTAREAGLPADSSAVSHDFPIELARSRGLWPMWAVTHITLAGLGWSVVTRTNPAVPLILQAITGGTQSLIFFAFNTLLVDVHPGKPSTAAAAGSLVRSGLSGIGVAVLAPLIEHLGFGWYFTLLAAVVGVLQGVGMWALRRWGMKWRQKRRTAEEEHEATAGN